MNGKRKERRRRDDGRNMHACQGTEQTRAFSSLRRNRRAPQARGQAPTSLHTCKHSPIRRGQEDIIRLIKKDKAR